MSEAPSASPLIGQEIGGRYRIVSLLGEGGMGSVFLGEQKLGATLRKVAIKTLHPHLSHDPKILARFERECATVAELQHPNTIQVYDFGKTDDGTLYIVMEFVEGRSVAEILEKEGPMEPARVSKIMQQVGGSLEEAHSRGIIHRDLKPDNIVLCERAGQRDWVEVLDFGIAKRSSEHDPNEQKLTQQGMVLGTPPYMSPEQFTGKPIDARSDIYSLGVMSYEMLTGRLPFTGNTAWEWATQHMTARPVAIESLPAGTRVPPGMRAAINRALSKQPEERFPTVREFIDAFIGDGSNVAAAAPPPDRPKTEMAQPFSPPPGAYGPPPQMQMQPPAQMAPPVQAYGTPASGHQAFASGSTGGDKKGPPKALLIGGIAILGLGSLAAILAGAGVFSGSSTDKVDPFQGANTAPPPATLPVTPTETATQPTAVASTPPVAPLDPAVKSPPVKTPTKTTTPTPTPSAPVSATPQTPPPQTPPPQTPPPQTPPPQKPPVTPPPQTPPAVIPECEDAKRFCLHPAMNKDPAITNLCVKKRQACFSKGGKI